MRLEDVEDLGVCQGAVRVPREHRANGEREEL